MPTARLALTMALLVAAPARAAGPAPLRHDVRTDAAITAVALTLWAGSELAKDRLAASSCRFCDTNTLDARVRELAVWSDGSPARRASDLVAFGVLPAAATAHQLLAARAAGDVRSGAVDLLLVLQAAALAADLNQIVKLSVGRQRPFVRYGNYPEPVRVPDEDDNLSFYSGHTNLAFAVASAAGTVSTLRGYDSAPWVWGVGMAVAASAGYFRIAADKHYFTDVLTGAAIGTAFGIAVPRLLHPRERDDGKARGGGATIVPVPLGVLVIF